MAEQRRKFNCRAVLTRSRQCLPLLPPRAPPLLSLVIPAGVPKFPTTLTFLRPLLPTYLMHDLLIRGATVFDGLGNPAQRADVAVRNGRIAAIGPNLGAARETIDAGGLTLMPGIVDLHTHYDAQITWDRTMSPSPALGVTTAVFGNCGFGIAPCPAPVRETEKNRG